ncbi:sugar transferase [Streptomyces sp. NPDC057963]|uniref:sugar transferase n=1 Tax=Streptomyces sp. NPDC057963 TaxID=3346290 RepID=UPI0036E2D5A8
MQRQRQRQAQQPGRRGQGRRQGRWAPRQQWRPARRWARQRQRRRRRTPQWPSTWPSTWQWTRQQARQGARRAGQRTWRCTWQWARRRERPSAKRVLDLALGSILLALAAPLLAAGALALAARRLPGGVLTRSPRVGLGGRPFVLRSLRTRRLRLDLLSRLPHVVRGDLSLVGPEPLAPDDHRTRTAGTPASAAPPGARHWRQDLKPGLTGLAQVRSRSGMPWDEPALLDQHYAEHHWVGLDLAILVRAAHTPLRRAVRGLTRHGKAHLSDTDHRRCGYSAAE